MKIRLISLLLPLCNLASLATAASAASALAWPEAVSEALKQNPSLASARLAVTEAQKGVTIADAGFLPSLNANAGFSRSGNISLVDDPALKLKSGEERDHSDYDGSLSVNWNLFNGFGTLASRALALQALARSEANYASASSSLLESLRQAFNTLLYDQKNLTLLQSIVQRYHQDTLYQELVFKSGRTPRWTYLKAKADEAEIGWQVSQLQLGLGSDQAALATQLGRDPSLAATSSLSVAGDFDAPEPPADDTAAQARVAAQHPSLRLALANVASAQAALLQSRSSFYPSLGASASYGTSGSDHWGPDSRGWSAGLSLSFNLFAGGASMAEASQSSLALEASRHDLQNERALLAVSLHKAWSSYSSAAAKLPVAQLAADAGEDRFNTVSKLYEAGREQFLDYEQAESTYTSAQQQQLSARLNAANAFAQYQNALGLGLEDILIPARPE